MVHKFKIGLFGIGLEADWARFKGFESRLRQSVGRVGKKLARTGVEIVNLGPMDTPAKALDACHRFRQADVDLNFLQVTTCALSSTVLPVVRQAKVPVILLDLQPETAIDYGFFNRMRRPCRAWKRRRPESS